MCGGDCDHHGIVLALFRHRQRERLRKKGKDVNRRAMGMLTLLRD